MRLTTYLFTLALVSLATTGCGGGASNSESTPSTQPSPSDSSTSLVIPTEDPDVVIELPAFPEPDQTANVSEDTSVSFRKESCGYPDKFTGTFPEKDLEIVSDTLPLRCGNFQPWVHGLNLVQANDTNWSLAIHGLMAMTVTYHAKDEGLDVENLVAIRDYLQTVANGIPSLPERIVSGSATEEESLLAAALLTFDQALVFRGYDSSLQRMWPLWNMCTTSACYVNEGSTIIMMREVIRASLLNGDSRWVLDKMYLIKEMYDQSLQLNYIY